MTLSRRCRTIATLLLAITAGCQPVAAQPDAGRAIDAALGAFIDSIRVVDNHTHINTTAPVDSEYDALPLDGIPFELPAMLRPDNPRWRTSFAAIYNTSTADSGAGLVVSMKNLPATVRTSKAEGFPGWVLDRIGTDVALTNRVAMGPGLSGKRFKWVSFVDALMLPLPTTAEAGASFDRAKLFPLEAKLLLRYLADLHMTALPATLSAYVQQVVTPTLESQRNSGCIAVKFEAGYLRSLDFADVSFATASAIYAKYAGGGVPSHAEYKALQDFLFRTIARESGRLGMAVHVHSFEGFGNGYDAAGSDPLLLEPTLNDTTLSRTHFVILHGGGAFSNHTGVLLWKPNVYTDMSTIVLTRTPEQIAVILRSWLSQFPEKVMYGSDAFGFGPDMGWEYTAWLAGRNARDGLAIALTGMMRDGDVSRVRAQEIAVMVLRMNASTLYGLGLK